MDDWHYKTADGEFGPITQEELAALARNGALLPTDGIRRGTRGEWVRPGQGLFDAPVLWKYGIEPFPEPLPQAGERDFYLLTPTGTHGPLTAAGVREMMVDGKVPRETLVRRGLQGVWFVPSVEWHDSRAAYRFFPLGDWITRCGDMARQTTDHWGVSGRVARVLLRIVLTVTFLLLALVVIVGGKALSRWLFAGHP